MERFIKMKLFLKAPFYLFIYLAIYLFVCVTSDWGKS